MVNNTSVYNGENTVYCVCVCVCVHRKIIKLGRGTIGV